MSILDNLSGKALVSFLYCLPFPGITRRFANRLMQHFPITEKNDCIFVQAFGRNDLSDDELPEAETELWRGRTEDEVMSVLDEEDFDPGASNHALALAALYLQRELKIPIIAQWEVAVAIYRHHPARWRRLFEAGMLFSIWPGGVDYFTAKEVKERSILLANAFGWFRPVELAHPDMIIRAQMILWKLGQPVSLFVDDIPYDEASAQRWTRNPAEWLRRNWLVHIHHCLKRWISFKQPVIPSSP